MRPTEQSQELFPKGARVLVVEDHIDLAANLCDYLEAGGWLPEHAGDGRSALALCTERRYDVVVLDLTLPRVDGLDVARAIGRGEGPPILMLTARDALEDRLEGFAAGADDYLVKPFAMRELCARLQALLRRPPRLGATVSKGDIVLDTGQATAKVGASALELSKTELSILELLMSAAPDLVARRTIERRLWGEDPPEGGALRTHVYRVRRELTRAGSAAEITTVRGVGYRLDVSPE